MAAGPASRLGSIEPGEKTGLRLSPHLAPSTLPRSDSDPKSTVSGQEVFSDQGETDGRNGDLRDLLLD